jgi:hypothetical protein
MFSADVVEYFFGGASASVGYVIKALTDTFHGVGTGRNVEQALIGVGILLTEGGQRLDILGDVWHGPAPVKHLSRC